MPARFSAYFRRRIVFLNTEGKSLAEIGDILKEEGLTTTKTTIRRWIYRWETKQGLEDAGRAGRRPCIVEDIAAFLNESLKKDNELSSRELSYLVSKIFGVTIAASTIRGFLRRELTLFTSPYI